MGTEKYRLFGQPDGAKCAFFFTPKGCRNGSKCKFLHTDPNLNNRDPKVAFSTSTDVSSESSDGNVAVLAAPAVKQEFNVAPSEPQKKRKKPHDDKNGNIFAAPKHINNVSKTSQPSEPTKTGLSAELKHTSSQKRNNLNGHPSFAETQRALITMGRQTDPQDGSFFVSPPQKKLKSSSHSNGTTPSELILSNQANFRQLAFPIASFSTVTKEVTTPKQTASSAVKKDVSSAKQKSTGSDVSEDDTDFFPILPVPKAPESIKWKDACLKSRAHAKYHSSFNFEKYKTNELQNGIAAPWIKTMHFGAWCRKNPQVIAIDCEMCETTCPLTGKIDGKALCRLSVINASNPDDILIDTLVKPDWPISDYRTRIHGIDASHLESVQFTLKHAQTFMMALCSEETVIIGHAVHNDLVALKMEHYCVADSSFLFEVKDEPGVCPSLRDVAMRVLTQEMPNIHDSVNDARISLKCLEEGFIKNGGSPHPIERCYPVKDRSDVAMDCSLLVHRIPRICKVNHLHQLFLSQTSIKPLDIPDIEYVADNGKVMISFQSAAHAKLAFDFISGVPTLDKGGRMQKKVYLRNTADYIVIRENCVSKL